MYGYAHAGEALKDICKQTGLTQKQLANRTGIAENIISEFINHPDKRHLTGEYYKLIEGANVFSPEQLELLRNQILEDIMHRDFGQQMILPRDPTEIIEQLNAILRNMRIARISGKAGAIEVFPFREFRLLYDQYPAHQSEFAFLSGKAYFEWVSSNLETLPYPEVWKRSDYPLRKLQGCLYALEKHAQSDEDYEDYEKALLFEPLMMYQQGDFQTSSSLLRLLEGKLFVPHNQALLSRCITKVSGLRLREAYLHQGGNSTVYNTRLRQFNVDVDNALRVASRSNLSSISRACIWAGISNAYALQGLLFQNQHKAALTEAQTAIDQATEERQLRAITLGQVIEAQLLGILNESVTEPETALTYIQNGEIQLSELGQRRYVQRVAERLLSHSSSKLKEFGKYLQQKIRLSGMGYMSSRKEIPNSSNFRFTSS